MVHSEQFERELHETLHLLRWLRGIIVLVGVIFAGMLLLSLFGLVMSFRSSGSSVETPRAGVHAPLLSGTTHRQNDVTVVIRDVQRTAASITVLAKVDAVPDAAAANRWRWMLDGNVTASANPELLADGSIRLTYIGPRTALRWLRFDAPGESGPSDDFYFSVGGR